MDIQNALCKATRHSFRVARDLERSESGGKQRAALTTIHILEAVCSPPSMFKPNTVISQNVDLLKNDSDQAHLF